MIETLLRMKTALIVANAKYRDAPRVNDCDWELMEKALSVIVPLDDLCTIVRVYFANHCDDTLTDQRLVGNCYRSLAKCGCYD